MTTMNTICPQCQSKQLSHRGQRGHLGLYCHDCGHWWAWAWPPTTLEQAEALRLPSGRYAGKLLGEVWGADQAYVVMLTGRGGSLGKAARAIVDARGAELYRAEIVAADDIPF